MAGNNFSTKHNLGEGAHSFHHIVGKHSTVCIFLNWAIHVHIIQPIVGTCVWVLRFQQGLFSEIHLKPRPVGQGSRMPPLH